MRDVAKDKDKVAERQQEDELKALKWYTVLVVELLGATISLAHLLARLLYMKYI
ncbi:hypothetical protein DPMN_047656 [Dreissena polymorpha]|uniref:Uncharacterized protein n=1 Tax=Dreissena polymorpha TaxID=45954 RepID=A0A9D4DA39_DREPO|nr:hypothetical protein DPMN_047656 [Dreissena polymorpha]